jgi:hypothetical protein
MFRVAQLRIASLEEYFYPMRLKMVEDAQILIAYHWKRHLKFKKLREDAALDK